MEAFRYSPSISEGLKYSSFEFILTLGLRSCELHSI